MARADIMAGRAFVSLYTKNDGLTRGLMKARADLNQFGSDMMGLGARLAAMSAAIAAPIGFAVKTFSDFDDAMRAVGAVTQSTVADLASMTAVAKELGRTTSFTAVEVAKLMTELGRAGFKPDQINAMTGAVMNMARATGTDATLASGIMAATIRQFNLEATDAAKVADVLTLAANSTFNTVEGLGESLKYAGPVAAELGMSLEDTVAILGTLGNVGIQGSEAGTALRRLGVISAATGEKLKATFNISNVDAAGKLKPLVQIMGEIGKSLDGVPVAEKVAKMNEAFGLLGITSASVLARTAGDTLALSEALKTAEGTAAKAAASMDAGLGGAFRIILSAVEGLQLAIGEALSGSIKTVTDSITGLLTQATEWVARNQGVVTSIAAIAAASGAAGAAIIAVGISSHIAAAGVGVLVSAYGAAKSAVMAAIVATKLWAAASAFAGVATWAWISAIEVGAGAMMLSSIASAAMASAWSAASTIVSAAWLVMIAPATPFIVIAGAAIAVIGSLAAAAAYMTIRATDFSAAWTVATGTLSELLDVAKQVGGVLMEALGGGDYDIAMAVAFAGIKLALAEAIDGMSQLWAMFWAGAWEMTKEFFSRFVSLSYKVVSAIAKAIANPTQAAASAISAALSEATLAKFSVGIDTAGMRATATAEIDRLQKELEARQAKRSAEQKAKAEAEAAKAGAAPAGPAGAGGDGTPFGAGQVQDEVTAEASATAEKAFERETEALQQQIIALRQGAEAAERFRLAKAGLTDAEIEQVMAGQREVDALQKQEEEMKRVVDRIRDFADADYEKNKLSPAEIAAKEKQGIENARQRGAITDKVAAEANAEADLRQSEREHQERLKAFKGEGGYGRTSSSSGGQASAATFSAASLVAMGGTTGQSQAVKAAMDTKKAIENAAKQAKEASDAQIAAIEKQGLHHA